MSGVDAASAPLTSHNNSDNDILDHDSLSATPHALLPAHAHHGDLDLDLACLAQSGTAIEDHSNHIDHHSRDQLFGDNVKEDHIAMLEAVDPAATQQDPQQASSELPPEFKRVKVYKLIGSQWVDQGTAYCFGQLDESQALLTARSEADFSKTILSTTIRSNDVYQRQQDSLIVWTEPDGVDYALSFQDADGCAEVWNFIIEVQRHLNIGEDQGVGSSSPGGDHSGITATIIRTGHLPSPQLGNIQDIEGAIKALARGQALKEKICEYIQRERYVKALIDVMNMAEDLESLENLHALCSLMQTILMMNDHGIYEHILEDDIYFGVVGMLEYDPEFPTHKANYREFLHLNTRFHQPIAIQDEAIRKKVHHTYRLQFLKDVVLARALDDSTFNVLNSCIIFNQIDIINHVQQDPDFLREIVGLYVSEEVLAGPRKDKVEEFDEESVDADGKVNVSRVNGHAASTSATPFSFGPPDNLSDADVAFRREVVVLIQQLCAMGKNVQLPARIALFRTLVDRGILFAAQWAYTLPEKEESTKGTVSAAGDIMSTLLDHDLHGVRGHVCKQAAAIDREKSAGRICTDKAETILKLLCRVMVQTHDVAIQCQVGDALKALLDVLQNVGGPGATPAAINAKMLARPKDDPGTERFLEYFYKNCIEVLFRPYNDIPDFRKQTEPILRLSREKTNLYLYLCDLLCNFAQQHAFRSHFYMLSSNISTRVATLMKARDKHLRLAAFRFFRVCLKINNRNFINHLMKLDVFKPILDLTLQESHRDSLLSASCQELFEHMRRENMKEPIHHCMTHHESLIRQLAATPLGGPRFTSFIRRWEINIEPPPKEEAQVVRDSRDPRRMGRNMDAEEEDYFNGDDDESDTLPPFVSSLNLRGRGAPPLNTFKRKRRGAMVASKAFRPQTPVLARPSSLPSLLDYGEEDEDIGPPSPEPSPTSPSLKPSTKSPASSPFSPSTDIPPSPRLAHRQISRRPSHPPQRPSDEDGLLDSLLPPKQAPSSPPLSSTARETTKVTSKTSLPPIRLAEKRRREDDDEDELLERLASKSKRVDHGTQKEEGSARAGMMKQGDDPPKRIKVKFRPSSIAATQSTLPVPSEAGAKDGDTG